MQLKRVVSEYLIENKKVTQFYIIGISIFYLLNFLFFRKSVDAPVDVIFSVIFIMFIPGLISFITILRSELVLSSNKDYLKVIMIHCLIPILISVVFALTYELFRIYHMPMIQWILLHALAFPVMFIGITLGFEIKSGFENLLRKIIIVFVILLTYYILTMSFSTYELRHYSFVVNISFIYILPIYLLLFPYRKKMLC